MNLTWRGRTIVLTIAGAVVIAALTILAVGRLQSGDALSQALDAHSEGSLEEAAERYRDVLEDEPSNKFAHYNLGLIHQTAGRSDSAAAAYRSALESDPRFVPALFNLAVLVTKPNPNEAIALYRKVIEIEPGRASAHLNLGFLLKQTGKGAEGDEELRKAVALDPTLEARIRPRPSPQGPATPAP
jgi:tetratricopeptide (TPR) repeat protein